MKRLLIFVLILCACNTATVVPGVEPISPQEIVRRADAMTNTAATQTSIAGAVATENTNATQGVQATANVMATSVQATNDTVSRDAVAMQTQAVALQTFDAAIIAPSLTMSAATQNAATTTQGAEVARTQLSVTVTASARRASQEENESTIWLLVYIVLAAALGVAMFMAIGNLSRGQAYKMKAEHADKLMIIEKIDNIWIVKMYDVESGKPTVKSLANIIDAGRALAAPSGEVDERMNEVERLRRGWLAAIHDAAQAASICSTSDDSGWSVSILSNRKGALGVMSEDTLSDITTILINEGWLKNYKGTRGVDWVENRSYILLEGEIEKGVFEFDLPAQPGGAFKEIPEIRLSNARQGKATTLGGRVVERGPMPKRERV